MVFGFSALAGLALTLGLASGLAVPEETVLESRTWNSGSGVKVSYKEVSPPPSPPPASTHTET